MNSIFPKSVPEDQGISSVAIWHMLDEVEKKDLEVISMKLIVNGHLILDFCKKPYETDCRQLWFSTTKAITGIGIGIACDRGLLSLDDSVISFSPDKLPPSISVNLQAMRVRDLLSMSCGIHENTYAELFHQDDWVAAFLAQEFPHKPGTYYRYSTHASHMLAAIAEKVTGIGFFDFIKIHLMHPLDIDDMTWEACKQGITCGGMGLGLTTEAIVRFGYMLLNHGVYNEKRIVSEQYLSQALVEQSDNRKLETKRHKNGYGFHMCIDHDGSFYHEGSFGQLCYVSPSKNAVFVVTSQKNNWDDVIDLFDALFLSCENSNGDISCDILENRLDTMSYPLPVFTTIPDGVFSIDGKSFLFDDNELKLSQVYFKQKDTHCLSLTLEYTDRPQSNLSFSFIEPSKGMDYFIKDIQYHIQRYTAYAMWQDPSLLVLTVFYIETPYVVTYTFCFCGNEVRLGYNVNVSFGIKEASFAGKLSLD